MRPLLRQHHARRRQPTLQITGQHAAGHDERRLDEAKICAASGGN
jgi:hypothetical protein